MRGMSARRLPATFTGIQSHARQLSWIFAEPEKFKSRWIPACAGMTFEKLVA